MRPTWDFHTSAKSSRTVQSEYLADIGDIGAESIGTIAKNPWSAKRSPHRLRVTDFEKGVTIV